MLRNTLICCCWYHKGTNFQANHNTNTYQNYLDVVVADTTKVRIFKQITTPCMLEFLSPELLLIPQRYEFSSKSQPPKAVIYDNNGCCWYHKGTNFQANHNAGKGASYAAKVVADTTKVRIFKQITTLKCLRLKLTQLLLIPQRYEFSSKSQLTLFFQK